MNEDQQGARQDGPGRRGSEPFIVGISEGVNAGYQALDYVLQGLRESVRLRRTGSGSTPASSGGRAGGVNPSRRGGGAPLDLDQVVGMVGDLLGSASDVAQEVARTVGERSVKGTRHEPHQDRLAIEAPQGGEGSTEFCVHNTSASVLKDVKLMATDMVGDAGQIASAVDFEPRSIEKIPPGRWAAAKVKVKVPERAVPGAMYRALLQGEPGGACATLEVVVTPKDPDAEKHA
jgi:hypothetical protein